VEFGELEQQFGAEVGSACTGGTIRQLWE
jgi:hypothetical protein